MLVEEIEFGKKIHVQTLPKAWVYAAELKPTAAFPDEPFILNCKAAIRGQGAVGFGALNAARNDFTHSVFLRESERQQSFDVVCDGRQNFCSLIVRTGDPATTCDVTLTIVGIKPLRQDNYTIFQYGKVGSQTVEAALTAVVPARMVERHHFLTPKTFTGALSMCLKIIKTRAEQYYTAYFQEHGVLSQVRAARVARQAYLEARKKDKAVLITGIRDPVEASYAAYFQQLELFCPGLSYAKEDASSDADIALKRFYAGAAMARDDLLPQSLSDQSLKSLFEVGIAGWFQTEFLDFTGIDILKSKFDSDAPFARFQENGHDVIVFRTERLDEAVPLMMESLGLAYRPAPTRNVGWRKPTGAIYSKFKELFVESEAVTRLLRDTDFCRRFYPEKRSHETRSNALEGLPTYAGS